MKEYEQDYYFENNRLTSDLYANEEKTVNRCFTVWLTLAIVTFVAFVAVVLTSIMSLNPFMVFIIFTPIELIGGAGYFVLPLLILANIVQHIVAIVNRIRYPFNAKVDKMFKADMIILAVTIVAIVVWIVSVGIVCNELSECG